MKNSLLRRMNRGLQPKKHVKASQTDDRSFYWKFSLLAFLMLFLFLSTDLTRITPVLLLIVGIAMLYKSIQRMAQFKLSHKWKVTTGELLYTKVAMDNPYAADRAKSYFPYMKYRYIVGHKQYISDVVANYRELRDFPEEIEALMERLSKPTLKVFYNPKKPSESLLIADMPLHRKVFWIFIFILASSSMTVGAMTITGTM